MSIPQIIHQTLPSKLDLAEHVRDNILKLKALNPSWTYRLYDDADIQNFIGTHYSTDILDLFNGVNPLYGAARADLFRYLLLFKVGGVYLDIKSSCAKPLNSFIREDDELLLSHWKNKQGEKFHGWGIHTKDDVNNEFQNWHIICAPGHPVLKAVIISVLDNLRHYSMMKYGVGRFGVFRTTGPIAYTKAITPILDQYPHRIFDSDESGLVYSIFFVSSPNTSHKKIFKSHYTKLRIPLISRGQQNIFHILYYRILKLFGLIS